MNYGNVEKKRQSTYLLYEFYFILWRYWIVKISLQRNINGSKQAKVGHYKFCRNLGCMLNSADHVIFDRLKSSLSLWLEIQIWFVSPFERTVHTWKMQLLHLSNKDRKATKERTSSFHVLNSFTPPVKMDVIWLCRLSIWLSEFEGWLWAHEH